MQAAVFHVHGVAAGAVAMRNEHAVRAPFGHGDVGLDAVGAAAQIGAHLGRQMAHPGVEGEDAPVAQMARRIFGEAFAEAVVQRQHLMGFGLAPPQIDQRVQARGLFRRPVVIFVEVGFEMTGNIGFKDFLNYMRGEEALELAFETPAKSDVPEFIEEKTPLTIVKNEMTIEELIAKAEANGFKQADIVTGAKIYHNQSNIYHLTSDQIADLDRRITARIEKMNAASRNPEELFPLLRTD